MNFNYPNILERISLGEDSVTELKSIRVHNGKLSGPKQNDIADEIAAFANSSCGGIIFFGVDDHKKIEGIEDNILAQVENLIRNACIDSIDPPLYAAHTLHKRITDASGNLKNIIELQIEPSIFVHSSPGGYFTRICDAKTKMKPDILARLFQLRSQARLKSFDEFPVPGAKKEDIILEEAKKYFNPNSEMTEILLTKSRILVNNENNQLVPSVAGILMFAREPQEYFPNAVIECVLFNGDVQDSNYQIDARRIEGSLFTQIDEAFIFVLKNMSIRAVKIPHRVETPQFSDRAIFEAIVNAVVHRDYSIYGSKIRLFLFRNRLEIRVPGALSNSVTTDSLSLRQFTRNELISRFLGRTFSSTSRLGERKKYMESRGDGVPLIIQESFNLSGKTPEYKLIQDELILTIWSS